MIRGTNPVHIFVIPFDTSIVEKVRVIYKQNNVEVLRKETDDCSLEDDMIGVKLSQEETMLFDHTQNVYAQLRVLTTEGDSYVSPIMVVSVGECMDKEVI